MQDLLIRRASPSDADRLAELGRRTFVETFVDGFAMGYPPEDLAPFLERAYAAGAFARQIADPDHAVWIADRDGEAVAYATAGPNALPHPEASPENGELYRLYVANAAQGLGLGRALLELALAWLERAGPRTLWIGVWSGNLKAQRLYARYGFQKVGEYDFPVGATLDREFILTRLPLSREAGEVSAQPTEGAVSQEYRRVQRVRRLRREMTPPEVRIWLRIKSPPPGNPRFRRQHPLGPFTLDFYCVEAKLNVEIDVWGHNMGAHPERDQQRDQWLGTHGIEVLRIPASEVMADPDAVADSIIRTALDRVGRS